ncbi:zinc-dependent alcohol dehydrogenase [Paracoccus tibetensis]|uniref:(R,R)-butanediol dehydrogenase / meso-butanediol dehydrogenase / diacetyl reductase n=1 Tax=Paracoccus tibetensis TaxID=336292 RepID=A0A1G5K755_9RHOB|nr:alcohol dehydrogenase catalytic domain-containing protein [Paracoccus tibetensis]SCY95920.1 (R,R)-butanediol dehydrogenase / meso-butanediol dehydrogenase / diacetyl reductase [Paracoccus tibetensis]
MRAVIYQGPDLPLRLSETPGAPLAADEVRLSLAACGICGSDLHMAHAPQTFGIAAGAVLGHEFAGTVSEVGADVTTLEVGQHVAVCPIRGCGACAACRDGEPAWCPQMRLIGGGYAEETVVAARQCRIVPDDVALPDAALAEPCAVALHAVLRARPRPGAHVLILGAGPIGLLVAFWARRMGAAEVVVADIRPDQAGLAATVGATRFEISDNGLADRLAQDGVFPQVVYECVGRPGLIDRAVALVAGRGTVVGVGLCIGPDSWNGFAALHKEVTLVMSAFFSMAEFEMALEALRPGQGAGPQKLITERITLDAAPDTFAKLQAAASGCKTIIEMSF